MMRTLGEMMGFKCVDEEEGPTGNQGFITRPEFAPGLFGIEETAAAEEPQDCRGWFRKLEEVAAPLPDPFPVPVADAIAV